MEITALLQSGIERLGLNIASCQQNQMLEYLELIKKWNKKYNLTAITDDREMVIKHLLDSLSIIPSLPSIELDVLDVGSGAGLPGIPLALALPKSKFILLDSNRKKTRFLSYVKIALNISNIAIVNSRVENYNQSQKFACIISRAVGSACDLQTKTTHLLAANGVLMLLKGRVLAAELPANMKVQQLKVPYLNAERNLLLM